jgi:putative transposase
MLQYWRSRATGGTFFFTVNLRDRRSAFLVEHIDSLRDIARSVHKELPFTIDAMVVLPDHWHSLWTLPPGDHGYARRIRLIKARFTSTPCA